MHAAFSPGKCSVIKTVTDREAAHEQYRSFSTLDG
jgi:hypothetical protein